MAIPPCWDHKNKKDCSRRAVGCASTCIDWQEYQIKKDEEFKKHMEESAAYEIANRMKEKTYIRMCKKRRGY